MNSFATAPEIGLTGGADERIEALIDITEALNLIFEEENVALEENRPEDAAPLQAEKARLAADYAQSIRAVAADRGGMAAVDEALLIRLRTITARFEARAARQRALLHGAADADFPLQHRA
ncbi:hypothetical protein [Hyphococcus sp.]|uniref:hypothetical protein n=1 Tax=Hyphococcus sp. TaxID=2038636 RepID=UPI003D0FA8DE